MSKMKIKRLIITGNQYDFFYDEHITMWRVVESPNFIEGQVIDFEIDLLNFTNQLDWNEVESFIALLKKNNSWYRDRIEDAKEVLKSLYKAINKGGYDKDFFEHVEFNLSGIDFKGRCKNINLSHTFEYDYFFFPQYSKDPYRDIGSFVWRANFRDNLLLGVYCDRI